MLASCKMGNFKGLCGNLFKLYPKKTSVWCKFHTFWHTSLQKNFRTSSVSPARPNPIIMSCNNMSKTRSLIIQWELWGATEKYMYLKNDAITITRGTYTLGYYPLEIWSYNCFIRTENSLQLILRNDCCSMIIEC